MLLGRLSPWSGQYSRAVSNFGRSVFLFGSVLSAGQCFCMAQCLSVAQRFQGCDKSLFFIEGF